MPWACFHKWFRWCYCHTEKKNGDENNRIQVKTGNERNDTGNNKNCLSKQEEYLYKWKI